jgi:hypothetical protein
LDCAASGCPLHVTTLVDVVVPCLCIKVDAF